MKNIILIFALLIFSFSCRKPSEPTVNGTQNGKMSMATTFEIDQPEWAKDATMYEVNIRQHSAEGTFQKVTEDLPRLKEMGIEIVWLMPVHPISVKKRKENPADLGSYYAVADYKAVNPDYGTLADLKALVNKAHALDMKVILDWVANHTGWDNPWIKANPEYYTTNEAGEIIDPSNPETGKSWGWTDVADLNYDNEEMQAAMKDALKYWITEADIDGYRCDVAGEVPTDFWKEAVEELNAIKPVFMLAEAEKPELADAFNMSYAWEFHARLNEVFKGEAALDDLDKAIAKVDKQFGTDHYSLMFTTNHDENSWHGTVFDRYGDGHKAAAVITFTSDGMPLMYTGQEGGNTKKLKFFTKDAVEWNDYTLQPFYKALFTLKRENPALWNGKFGGDFQRIKFDGADNVYAFKRIKDKNEVIVAANVSDKKQAFDFPADREKMRLSFGDISFIQEKATLPPYGYAVWTNKK